MWVEAEQNGVVSYDFLAMVLHVRYVPKCSEGNSGLREGSMELRLIRVLLDVYSKSQNVTHQLGM